MLVDGLWIDNVVRMPIERRNSASFAVLAALAPDWRVIDALVETLEIENFDYDVRHTADEEMAAWLVLAQEGRARAAWVPEVIAKRDEAVRAAIQAAGAAKAAADVAAKACTRAADARDAKSVNAEAFHALANEALKVSAEATLKAHVYAEAALGQARAIRMALEGEPWQPATGESDTDWLIEETTPVRVASRAS